jgi:hypothetical protein
VEKFPGIGETGPDILLGNVRITFEYLLMAPPGGEEVHHELNRNPSPSNHGLAHQYLRINYDAAAPVHETLSFG